MHAESKGKVYEKIWGSCAQAMQDGLKYVWLDTCCVDRNNSTWRLHHWFSIFCKPSGGGELFEMWGSCLKWRGPTVCAHIQEQRSFHCLDHLARLAPSRVSLLHSDLSLTSSETFHNIFNQSCGGAVEIMRSRSSHRRCYEHDGVRARAG